MEASADVSMDSGCIRVFQRLSTSERQLSLENCTYRHYQNELESLLRVRIALLLKATSESGESDFLTSGGSRP